ncbi:hypothetical protein MRX96_014312 [Rhipicephalus microplus]
MKVMKFNKYDTNPLRHINAIAQIVPGDALLGDFARSTKTPQLRREWPLSALRSTCISKGVSYHLHHAIATLEGRFLEPPLQSDYLWPQAHSRILLLQRLAAGDGRAAPLSPNRSSITSNDCASFSYCTDEEVETIRLTIDGEGEFHRWTNGSANCSRGT